jgi:hypothetical protein
MRTAILITGHIRTWEQCKDNFIESFGHLNPDIFLSTYDLQYNYHPAQKMNWMYNQPDNLLSENFILNLFSDLNLKGFDFENILNAHNDFDLTYNFLHPNFQNELHTILQARKIIRAFELLEKYEENNNFIYDNVIKLRSDIHHNKFDYEIHDKNVIISDKNVFPNDVLIASKKQNFKKIIDFIKNEFFSPKYQDSHLKAPHNLFLRAFEDSKLEIEQKDSMKYVVRISGIQTYT